MKFISYSLMFLGSSLSSMVLYTMFLGSDGVDYHDIILMIISFIGLSTFVVGAATLRMVTKPPMTPREVRLERRQRRSKALARI
jgi:Na+/proline symporter